MKKLWEKADLQTMLGGIFGIIAMTAIIYEMSLADFDSASVVGGIKDAASILVTIIVLIIAVRKLIPKKQKLSFEERLKNALEDWRAANSRLIVKSTDDKKGEYGFSMRTNVKDFYHSVPLTKNVGWFVRMPAINAALYEKGKLQINFHLNKGTFFEGIELTAEQLQNKYNVLGNLFCKFIVEKYGSFLSANFKEDTIYMEINPGIQSDEDINRFIEVLNSMIQAYLVAATMKV